MYAVPLKEIVNLFNLEVLYMPEIDVNVTCRDVNRPGLPLSGFYDHFEPQRIQIIGKVEYLYLQQIERPKRKERIRTFLSHESVAVIITTNLEMPEHTIDIVKEFNTPLLRTSMNTSEFMQSLIYMLSHRLAPRITRHGVFVEVYGEGVFITGESGIGKSEAAVELVKRGHRLIADDAVEIKKTNTTTVVGTSPSLIKHYMELRGIGIIDVRRIFGTGAVKDSEKINLVVALEHWNEHKPYDRFGLETEYEDIMGVMVPKHTIPVKPGRNLAVVIEIAAMNQRLRKMGYNTAAEFEKKLMGEAIDD